MNSLGGYNEETMAFLSNPTLGLLGLLLIFCVVVLIAAFLYYCVLWPLVRSLKHRFLCWKNNKFVCKRCFVRTKPYTYADTMLARYLWKNTILYIALNAELSWKRAKTNPFRNTYLGRFQ